jgi:hypothetical protein
MDSRRSVTSKLHKTGSSAKGKSIHIEEIPDKLLDLMGICQGSARKHAMVSIVYEDKPLSSKNSKHNRFRQSVNNSNASDSVKQNRVIAQSMNSYRATKKNTHVSDGKENGSYGKMSSMPIRKDSLYAPSQKNNAGKKDLGSKRNIWSHRGIHKDKKFLTGVGGGKGDIGVPSKELGKDKGSGFELISPQRTVPSSEKLGSDYTFSIGKRKHGVKIKVIFGFLKF